MLKMQKEKRSIRYRVMILQLENQVNSVEQGKKLKEFGIIDSHYSWTIDELNNCWALSKLRPEAGELLNRANNVNRIFLPAFTVAELGELIPQTIRYNKTQKASVKYSRFNAWTVFYNRHSSGSNVFMTEDKIEAIARAAMLLRLLNEGILAPKTAQQVKEGKD